MSNSMDIWTAVDFPCFHFFLVSIFFPVSVILKFLIAFLLLFHDLRALILSRPLPAHRPFGIFWGFFARQYFPFHFQSLHFHSMQF